MEAVTVEQVIRWKPCKEYTRERVAELFAGRKELTALEILDLDIASADKLWAVLREDLIPANDLHELACRFAESVLPIFEDRYPNDNRPRQLIEVKRQWLRGEATDEELAAARAVARDATRDATWDAARDATWDATWDAANDAANDAARGAARDATWVTARVAARVAARDVQVELVRDYLKGGE